MFFVFNVVLTLKHSNLLNENPNAQVIPVERETGDVTNLQWTQ
jgi:hypothetical protein